jgi:hypothetical protein
VIDNSGENNQQFQQAACAEGAAHQRWRRLEQGSVHQIQSVSSGKCMSVADGSQADGARVRQWDCLVKPNFLFEVRSAE